MTITETQKTAQLAADAAVSAAEAKQYMLEAEQGYQDTSAAAQQAQDAAGSALLSKQSAATSEENSLQYATEAGVARDEAVTAASNASEYAQNKFTFYKTASDPDGTIAGLAATTDGQSFWVAQGPDALSAAWQYQNKAGVAVLQAKQPGTAAITGTIREFPTLAAAQADADAGNIPVGSTAYYRSSDDSALAVEVINNAGTLQPTGRKMPSQNYINSMIITDDGSPIMTVNDDVGFRLAALGRDLLQNRAIHAEYDDTLEGFIFRDSVGFIIQQIGVPLLSDVDDTQPIVEQEQLVTKALHAEATDDVTGVLFRDSVGFILLSVDGEQQSISDSDSADIAKRNSDNIAAADAMRAEINYSFQRPVFDINIIVTYGQSYSNGTQGVPCLTREIKDSLNLKMLGMSVRPLNVHSGSTFNPVGSAALNNLVAVNQSDDDGHIMTDAEVIAASPWSNNYGESVDIASLQMWRTMQFQQNVISSDSRQYVALNCGVGGQIIENLEKGASTGFYNRIISAVTQVKGIADAAGKTCGVVGLLYLGNEYNYDSTKGGTTDRVAYRNKLRGLIDDFISDTIAITGQESVPLTLLYQTGGSYTRDVTKMSIGEAQLDICAADQNVMMASPNYMVTGKGGHPDANGYRWLASQFGKVLHRVQDRSQQWKPLQPRNITIKGTLIRIDFLVWSPPLKFMSSYAIGTVAQDYSARGFRVTDDLGDVPISSVKIVAATVVDLELSRETSGSVFVWYGSETASGGCGNLFDSDGTISLSNYEYRPDLGERSSANITALVNKPYPLNNPCVAFYRQATSL
ncbi:hypothetical protein V3F54_19815 [Klebsiella pneumoniae]|uniref:Sialate O-acetylesterase domain-containing protein n=4 Tax=Klebsiella pneumoniae TaxID=573 RepID=A0A483YSP3_KLEPN|nr:hypothetical protein [Klebsiella pneumoniae]HDT0647321.1 hypothetical protein [Klebsiella pneumoniae subsp. ozaenae]ASG58235.1 hypothetical protein CEV20_07600 [Klebsiella pneumoniae]EKD6430027.1 hypothetical protein [Klebsiella pneumoniae]EKZ9915505.1 hypothetical protein [Klebsiella pneumoniae]ELA1626705.1 hypothetical protein [Klebsiella pneumoniae]